MIWSRVYFIKRLKKRNSVTVIDLTGTQKRLRGNLTFSEYKYGTFEGNCQNHRNVEDC